MPRVALPTGVVLDYFECGRQSGPVLLFVHGYIDSWRVWERVLPLLPQSYRLVCVTQRGFGDSDKPMTGYGQLDFVRDLEAFAAACNIEHATVIGQSMGGLIAHYLAIRNPGLVERLVLAGTAPSACASDIVGGSVSDTIARLTDPLDPAFVRLAQTEQIRDPVPAEFVDMIVHESAKAPARVWREAMAGMLAEDHADHLPEIACPTLILYGDGDMYFTPDEQRQLVRKIPNASLKIYAGAGHGIHWERPDEFARDITAFLAAAG